MKIELEPGKYVVAVSGGVDSVVLLDILSASHIVVAHFDHGMRQDSIQDRQFVEGLAKEYGLSFYYDEGKLGQHTSEATARRARYHFLEHVRQSANAMAIVTAHHQDDVIETAFINLLRGTGRKGLSSLGNHQYMKRPLLHVSKKQIRNYARAHNLAWREDSTNQNDEYLRNYLRNRVLPRLTLARRRQLIDTLESANTRNDQIDEILERLLPEQLDRRIDRAWFIALPHAVAKEVLSHWLRAQKISFDRSAIERLTTGLKILPAGSRTDVGDRWYYSVDKDSIRLQRQSSV